MLTGAGAALAAARLAPTASAAVDRALWWPPQGIQRGVVLEWRYLAGRISDATRDFGFVVSLVDYKDIPILQTGRRELIVMRQDFKTGAHQTRTYAGTLSYSAGTYSFATTEAGASATASWSYAAGAYSLSVATSELTLSDIALAPVGAMIPEGGSGTVAIGNLGGAAISSDYYGDWVRVSEGGAPVGHARLDIQTIRPQGAPDPSAELTHHWFALAGEAAGQPAWVTAWRLETAASLSWGLTIARGQGAGWQVQSYTEASPGVAHPLEVQVLDWQPVPGSSPPRRTGRRWSVRAGKSAPADLVDLIIDVPAGQFIRDARVLGGQPGGVQMQEAIGIARLGAIAGQPITTLSFTVGESTDTEPDPGPGPQDYPVHLPLVIAP